jgi:1-acyl-sn-glycerol-3-phosphate acyltransferase
MHLMVELCTVQVFFNCYLLILYKSLENPMNQMSVSCLFAFSFWVVAIKIKVPKLRVQR